MINLVLIGAPGSGKGTQASYIIEKYKLHLVSTGDLLRKVQNDPSNPFCKKVLEAINKGQLVSNDIVTDIIEREISLNASHVNGFLFDGYPRSLEQNDSLQQILTRANISLSKILYLKIDHNFLLDRIVNRFFCADCGEVYNKKTKPMKIDGVCDKCGGRHFSTRSDDKEEIVMERFKVFEASSMPILNFYKSTNLIHEIDASQSIDKISRDIDLVVSKVSSN